MADEFTATTPAHGDTDWFLLAKATASSYQLCVAAGLTDAQPPMNGDTENTLLKKLATNLEQLVLGGGTGGGGSGLALSQQIYVTKEGDDSEGEPNNAAKPYLTVAAAYAAAVELTGGANPVMIKLGVGIWSENLTLSGTGAGGSHIYFKGENQFATDIDGTIALTNGAFIHFDNLNIGGKVTLASATAIFLDDNVTLESAAENILTPDDGIVVCGSGILFLGTSVAALSSGAALEITVRGACSKTGTLGTGISLSAPMIFDVT